MLHLLQEIFEQVIVPEAVWREITSDDASKAGVQALLAPKVSVPAASPLSPNC